MEVFLPRGFEAGLGRPRASHTTRSQKLRVEADGIQYPVLRRWATGFAVSAAEVPALGGVVSLYDGKTDLGECLITKSESAQGETIFTIKCATSFNYALSEEIGSGARAGSSAG